MKALILAGGFATRLWPLTERRAKPLLFLDGKSIVADILEKIPKTMDTYLLTNTRFKKDFEKELVRLRKTNVEIYCEDAQSDKEKKGALGAISLFLEEKNIQDTILVFAGDNIFPDFKIEQIFCSDDTAKITVREVDSFFEAQKFGVVEFEKNPESNGKEYRVHGFEEKPEHPKSRFVNTGLMGIGKNLVPILHEFVKKSPDALGAVFSEFLRQGRTVLAEKVESAWFDIGSFETYLEAHRSIQKDSLKKGENVQEEGNEFFGKVFLGQGVTVKNCKLYDCLIYPGCHLENCHVSYSVIDENCHLQGLDLNHKLVRKDTVLNGNL